MRKYVTTIMQNFDAKTQSTNYNLQIHFPLYVDLIMSEAGTVIVSLVSSNITSFLLITTFRQLNYLHRSKSPIIGPFGFNVMTILVHTYLCFLTVKLRLLSDRTPQLNRRSS